MIAAKYASNGMHAAIALRTGTGHGPRDTYASLVRWNVPTVEVVWRGAHLATLEGAFSGPSIRTYTGDPGEVEQLLERLHRGRQAHPLVPLSRVPLAELEALSGIAALAVELPTASLRVTTELRPPADLGQ